MADVHFVTHPEVAVDPSLSADRWPLSDAGCVRLRDALGRGWTRTLRLVASSDERPALEAAGVIAAARGIARLVLPELAAADRAVDALRPAPARGARGGESAAEARRRIAGAVREATRIAGPAAPLAIVSDGVVGGLLRGGLSEPGAPPADAPAAPGRRLHLDVGPDGSMRLVEDWQPIEVG